MTVATQPIRPLFRVAAGPRLGFGHLVRASRLAAALGPDGAEVSVRGPMLAQRLASTFGLAPVSATRTALLDRRPDVLIVDDPSGTAGRPWGAAARHRGVPVVSVHDLGLGYFGADLVVDGSLPVAPFRDRDGRVRLAGTRFTILDPLTQVPGARRHGSVLIALGGGPRLTTVIELAGALRRLAPWLEVRIAGGFAVARRAATDGVTWLGPLPSLAPEFATCAVAITGGGVSMYEAAAMRVPLVAWPVVDAQLPAVRAFVRHGLAVAVVSGPERAARAARQAARLAARGPRAPRTAAGRALDGRGAERVAAAIRSLVQRRQREAA